MTPVPYPVPDSRVRVEGPYVERLGNERVVSGDTTEDDRYTPDKQEVPDMFEDTT